MLPRLTLPLLLLLALSVGAVGWGWGWREHQRLADADFVRRRVEFLEGENRRLGGLLDGKQRAEDLAFAAAQRVEIEHEVTQLRSLPFLRRVIYREIPRSQLPEILSQKLAQQVPDQEFGDTAVALAALGLLPPGIDLKKTYLGLLGEQVGAFYDQHSQELFTFSGQSLNNSQNRVILAHELTHALEDQQFNLSRLPLEAKGNDDRALAASALVEGDATLVMNRYMVGNLSAAVLRDSLTSALTTDVRQLAAAPRYLRETLLFPYLHGLDYCQTLYDRGGWDALAKAFQHPPASTAEILHPERFFGAARPEPVVVSFGQTMALGQRPMDDNVLGEFGIRQLVAGWTKDDPLAVRAAEGWRGDRFLVYGDRTASSYVWKTCWVDQAGAKRFCDAMARGLSARYKGAAWEGDEAAGDKLLWHAAAPGGENRSVMMQRVGTNAVLIVDAQDARWFAALQRVDVGAPREP